MKFVKGALLVFALLVLGFILLSRSERGGAWLLNTMAPGGSYTLSQDIVYGDDPRQTLDIYRAKYDRATRPVLVFVHGGGWYRGDKSMYEFMAQSFTKAAYTVVLPNYRLYPQVKYPDFLYDTAGAIAKTRREFPDRPLVLIGHSAGAYNVMMLGFAPEYLQGEGVEPCTAVAGIVSLAGPTGALPMEDEPYITIFPDRLQGPDDNALAHKDTPVPPLYLLNGKKDDSVDYRNAEVLGQALAPRNVAEVKIYPKLDHIDVVKQFSYLFDWQGDVREDVMNFIETLPSAPTDNHCR